MTAATESTIHHARRQRPHTPRPLPVWLQVGAVLLVLWNGLQAIVHYNEPSLAANTAQAAPQAQYEYFYQTDDLRAIHSQAAAESTPQARTAYDPYGAVRAMSSGSQLATFQYSATYAHAPSAVSVTPMRAYAPSTGRWVDRDPLPAK